MAQSMNKGGRPQSLDPRCFTPGCQGRPRSRLTERSTAQGSFIGKTVCHPCYKRYQRQTALECSWQACRNLRQWHRVNAKRRGYCREHEREFLVAPENEAKVKRKLALAASNIDDFGDCWLWRVSEREFRRGRTRGCITLGRDWTPYRFVYLVLVRALTARKELDHLCARATCLNPTHLEPVSKEENKRRTGQRRRGERNLNEDVKRNADKMLSDPHVRKRLVWFTQLVYPDADARQALEFLANPQIRPDPRIHPSVVSLFYHRKD